MAYSLQFLRLFLWRLSGCLHDIRFFADAFGSAQLQGRTLSNPAADGDGA